jgi:uncharacterized membrane protein YhaH (DUF805 family)
MNWYRAIDRKDFFSGVVTLALGLFALIESLRMPRLEHLQINPYTVPGLVPGLIGAVLTVLGLMLTARALKQARAAREAAEQSRDGARDGARDGDGSTDEPEPWLNDAGRRVILTLAVTIAYAGFLFGRVPFTVATVVFIFCFTVGSEWLNRTRPRSLGRTAIAALVLALAAAFAVEFVFEEIFRVRLTR